uniref:hypothetical protein n=1 Tax=Scandinavium goeteborgense TaxID=1851514 RepID=UPI0013584FF5|nr:hypothetical protein [Scandinavium goeteborgense]
MSYAKEGSLCYKSAFNKPAGIYPMEDNYGVESVCLYKDLESEKVKLENKIDFNITVKAIQRDLYAFITLKNNGNKDLFIWMGMKRFSDEVLSGDFFNIVSAGVRLDYLGVVYNFGRFPESTDDYVALPPGHQIDGAIKLNEYYQFLPGVHDYDIGTAYVLLTHEPVTGKWFSPDESFTVRSNRVVVQVNGDDIFDKMVKSYIKK